MKFSRNFLKALFRSLNRRLGVTFSEGFLKGFSYQLPAWLLPPPHVLILFVGAQARCSRAGMSHPRADWKWPVIMA